MCKDRLSVLSVTVYRRNVPGRDSSGGGAYHPSSKPYAPWWRQRDEALQTGLDAPEAAPGERGQAAAEIAGLAVRAFFVGRGVMGRVPHAGGDRQEQRHGGGEDQPVPPLGAAELAPPRPKPRLLESENMASTPT